MEEVTKLPLGIYTTAKYPNIYKAQYYDPQTKHPKHIGTFDNVEDAVAARNEFIENLTKYNGKVLPIVKSMPKGIKYRFSERKGDRFDAIVEFWHGKYNDKMVNARIGTFDSIEEAVQARLDFIEALK